MQDGEEENGMPPNSTQNLNAKLSLTPEARSAPADRTSLRAAPDPELGAAEPDRRAAPPTISGGYHLSF